MKSSATSIDVLGNLVSVSNISHPGAWHGITIQNCRNVKVESNSVSTGGTATSGMEQTMYGISIESSEQNLCSQNAITKFGTGLRFFHSNAVNTVSCNALSENYRQITMENSTIGDQGNSSEASDNTWVRGSNTNANLCAIGTSFPNKWWVHSSSGSYYPGVSTGYMDPPGYYSLDISSPATSCDVPCGWPECLQERLAKIINEEDEYDSLPDVSDYYLKRYAFETIMMDSALLNLNTDEDSILQAFYTNYQNTNISTLSYVKNGLYLDPDLESIAIMIDELEPNNTSETNEEIFNEIYLATWANDIFDFDTTFENALEEIAYQNPIYGGMAVYGARVMLNLDITDYYEEPELRLRSIKNTNQNLNPNYNGQIVPNPNTGSMKYIWNFSPQTKGLFKIYDLVGNLVKTIVLNPNQKEVDINLSDFSEGIYLYKANIDDSIHDTGKIILQK